MTEILFAIIAQKISRNVSEIIALVYQDKYEINNLPSTALISISLGSVG